MIKLTVADIICTTNHCSSVSRYRHMHHNEVFSGQPLQKHMFNTMSIQCTSELECIDNESETITRMLIMVDERSAALGFGFHALGFVLPHILSLYHIVGDTMHVRPPHHVHVRRVHTSHYFLSPPLRRRLSHPCDVFSYSCFAMAFGIVEARIVLTVSTT